MAEEDDFNEKSEAFIKWLLSVDGAWMSSKISLADLRDRGAGRGVVAVEDIDEDEELFHIPHTAVLSVETSSLASMQPSLLAELEPWLGSILVLMHEHLQGEASPWRAYLDVLPTRFDTLMFWSAEEIAELQASAVVDKIGRAETDELFREQLLPLVNEHKDLFYPKDTPALAEEELLELAHRMGSTVMAYAFDIVKEDKEYEEGEDGFVTDDDDDEVLTKGMIPLADMLNSDAVYNARLHEDVDSFRMRSTRRIKKGGEVLNDYGPLPRSDLLRRYGYTTPQYAPHDVVEIPQTLLLDAIRARVDVPADAERKGLAFLDAQGLLDDAYLLPRSQQHPSTTTTSGQAQQQQQLTDLLSIAVLFLARDDKFNHFALASEGCRTEHSSAAEAVVRDVARARLAQYGTSAAEDRRILDGEGGVTAGDAGAGKGTAGEGGERSVTSKPKGDANADEEEEEGTMSLRKRMAIEVRLAEKEILEEVIAACTSAAPAAGEEGDVDEPSGKRRKLNG